MSLKELVFLDRTLRIPWFDRKKMKDISVTVIGAGNTGSQLLLAIYGLGLKRIFIVDKDVVELSNIQRQFIYSERDLGRPKAEAARDFLLSRFSGLSTEIAAEVCDISCCRIPESDYIFCCVDNDSARRAALTYCLDNEIPLIDMALEFNESQAGYVLFVDRKRFPDGACTNCYIELDGKGYGAGCIAAGISYSGGIAANIAAGMFVQHVHEKLELNHFFFDVNSSVAGFMFLKRRKSCEVCGDE
ncbi:hypothetical protein DRP04_12595 [Archaeoglobales archaeon]|nr:MAG: hypothetical protein DRP04_12595 [Archaeoglobales archaeon]